METKVSADAAVASIELGQILLEDVEYSRHDEFEIRAEDSHEYFTMADHEDIRECGFNVIGVSTQFNMLRVEYVGESWENLAYYSGEHTEVGKAFEDLKAIFGDSITHAHGPRFEIDLDSTRTTTTRHEIIRGLGFKIYTTDFEDNVLRLAHPQDYVPPEDDEE